MTVRKRPSSRQKTRKSKAASQVLTIAYCGVSVQDGKIDLPVLAPALTGMNDLLSAADQETNPTKSPIKVAVSGFKQGSFSIQLNLDRAKDDRNLFDAVQPSDSNYMLNLLGFSSSQEDSLISLIKWLKGRSPKKINSEGDNVLITVDSEQKRIKSKIFSLFLNEKIRESLEKIIQPLTQSGIESLNFIDEKYSIPIVKSNEVSYFRLSDKHADEIDIFERRVQLLVSHVSFEGGHKWLFKEKENRFFAKILDTTFLRDVARRQVAFVAGGYLDVTLRTKRITGINFTSESHEIVHVFGYVPPPVQLPLI